MSLETSRDTQIQKTIPSLQDSAPPPLSPDLAGIIAAWPSVPDQIKAAVKAVLAPYLDKEGGE